MERERENKQDHCHMWYKMSSVEILCCDIVVFLMENHNYKYLVEIIFYAQFHIK